MFGTTSLLWNASRTVDGRLSAIQVFRTGAFGARPYLFFPSNLGSRLRAARLLCTDASRLLAPYFKLES